MNNLSIREKVVFAILGMVALYVVTALMWFLPKDPLAKKPVNGQKPSVLTALAPASWTKAAREYDKSHKKYLDEEKLISQRQRWNEDYETEKSRMPTFEYDADETDTKWQGMMYEYAKKYSLVFRVDIRNEEQGAGEVLERTVELSDFEGALEPLVKFIYELNTTSEGMFDVKSLNLKPSNKRGYLKGSLTITCAYMKNAE